MDEELLQRQAPQALEAEQSVLGSMLIDERCVPDVVGMLQPDDFYLRQNREIYETIYTMFNFSEKIDPVTVLNKMKERGVYDEQRSYDYIAQLLKITPTAANVKQYCTIVHDKSLLRALATASSEITEMVYDGVGTAQEMLEVSEKKIYSLRRGNTGDSLQHIGKVMINVYDRLEELAASGSEIPGLSTGLHDLDRKINGLNKTDLILIAARPGMGKTAIALNICLNVAKTYEKTVAFFSLEMSREQLVMRLLSTESFVENQKLTTGHLDEEDWGKLSIASSALSQTDIRVDDNPAITVAEINAKCRRLDNLGLVLIDYLQLMTAAAPGKSGDNRVTVVSDISRALKIMAKELIGGAGMSVLAEMLHAEGVAVDGSDRAHSAKTDRLETLGITVEFGQRAENVAQAETVVYSSAIKPDNPEIVAAHAAGKRIVHRSDILALLMNGKRAVTVAGAHGKTTTSSMLSHILVNAGADPSYAIGGFIQGPDGTTLDGGHAGKGDILVAEADESDGSFAKYHPTIAIITNCEADHLDHYGDEAHYRAAFVAHAGRATGHVIISIDDPDGLAVLEALPADVKSHTVAYGTTARESLPDLGGAAYVWIASESETAGSGVEQLTLHLPAAVTAGEPVSQSVALKVPGVHNARNAAAAISAAVLLGVSPADAAKAAGTFLGAARRFQVRGTVKQVTVVDDYAHHPTEIAALLDAARRRYPDSTIRVIFQPHLFSRTKFFAHQFAKSLAKADDVIITGIFPAREKQADFPDISPSTIVDAAAGLKDASAGTWIQPVEDMCLAAKMMAMRAHHGDVIFTVGAGDITDMDQVLLTALEAHRESCE